MEIESGEHSILSGKHRASMNLDGPRYIKFTGQLGKGPFDSKFPFQHSRSPMFLISSLILGLTFVAFNPCKHIRSSLLFSNENATKIFCCDYSQWWIKTN